MVAAGQQLVRDNLHGVFGERDAERRRATALRLYTEDVRFVDPEETVVGVDALLAKAAALLEGAPGFVFTEDGPAYGTSGRLALPWAFGPEGGPAAARGIDVLTAADDRVSEVLTLLAPA